MNPSLKHQLFKTFIQMVDDLKDKKEIEKFLTDFFSEDEFEKYIKRLAIIYWLSKGRSNENIEQNLLSTPKEIAEAKESLKKEGVKLAVKKMEAEEFANVWAERIKKLGTGR